MNQNKKRVFLCLLLCLCTLLFSSLELYAAPDTDAEPTHGEEAEERKNLPIQSNQIENWPSGPAIGAQAAILLEANTGVILYAKNIEERLAPASTTKLMTCLLAVENCNLDETITFSHDAVFSLERGSSTIGIDPGQAMPLEECLYGILVASANEVANAVAEHVAGSLDNFADKMNEKAAELGCKNTHFINAHGLYDENHYTSAYDLALIAQAFFQNELLAKIGNTVSHDFKATPSQPDEFTVRNKHQLITGEIPYDGIRGGKTGYTNQARQTLVTCAEQNGMKLICVILKEESPEQFYDTVKLFDYGFTNFAVMNVSENDTRYTMQNASFFHTSNDVFGNSDPILALNPNSYVIMPKTASFDNLDTEISYETAEENEVATIRYSYHGAYIGTATVDLATESVSSYEFSSDMEVEEPNVVVLNIKKILIGVIALGVVLTAITIIHSIIINHSFIRKRRIFDYRTSQSQFSGKEKAGKKNLSRKKGWRKKRNRNDGPHF